MKTYVLPIGALLLMFALTGFTATEARAQGFHFGAGGVHVDVGNPHGSGYPHGYYGNYGSYYPGLSRGCGYGGYPYTSYYGGGWGGWGGGSYWHDTTHLDYHPGEFVRHRNHFHYVPGHYDVHEDGHWHHD